MSRLVLLFTSLIFSIHCGTNKKGNNVLLQAAVKDFDKGEFQSCQIKLLEYTDKYPEDDRGWSFLGTVALKTDNDSLASLAYTNAITINPKDYKALTGLGVLARHNKNYDQAADYYNRAILIDPTYAKAYSSLVIIELKKGNVQKAIELGEKAVKLEPAALDIKGNLAVAYHVNKEFEKRDSLVNEMIVNGYPDVDYLKLFFEGVVTLEDL